MRDSGPIRLLLRGILFLPLVFLPYLLDGVLRISGLEARHRTVYQHLAQRLRAGETISVGWDLRALKRYATPLPPSTDILVIGSSRSLAVSGAWFPGKTLWNASVDFGTLEDSAVLLQTALNAGRIPKTVILEVSASLGRDPAAGTSNALDTGLAATLAHYGVPPPPQPSRWFGLEFSWLEFSWSDATRRFAATVTDLNEHLPRTTADYVIRPDGAFMLMSGPQYFAARSKVRAALNTMPAEQVEARSRSIPTPRNALLFTRMLDDLAARGIEVIILTPPIHPAAWDFFHKRGGYDDTWLRHALAGRPIRRVGSYAPADVKATERDFFDAFHPRPRFMRELLTEAGLAHEE